MRKTENYKERIFGELRLWEVTLAIPQSKVPGKHGQ
jgi:hypothetical protein